jgi:hypothetical protein
MKQAAIAELERKSWLQTKSRGRGRFIRARVFVVTGTGSAILVAVDLLGRSGSHLRDNLLTYLVMLPIFVLGGYLQGRWEWQDLEKKYSA